MTNSEADPQTVSALIPTSLALAEKDEAASAYHGFGVSWKGAKSASFAESDPAETRESADEL
jgi:hypothetical protein